uniref:Hexosyltransferase n=1 Tax=Macrostomum lignano TaxID=282301 RepID=A0A1I8G650_9PLAT
CPSSSLSALFLATRDQAVRDAAPSVVRRQREAVRRSWGGPAGLKAGDSVVFLMTAETANYALNQEAKKYGDLMIIQSAVSSNPKLAEQQQHLLLFALAKLRSRCPFVSLYGRTNAGVLWNPRLLKQLLHLMQRRGQLQESLMLGRAVRGLSKDSSTGLNERLAADPGYLMTGRALDALLKLARGNRDEGDDHRLDDSVTDDRLTGDLRLRA